MKNLHLDSAKENDKAKFLEHYLSITECFPLSPKHLHQLPPLAESPQDQSRKEDDVWMPSYITSPAVQGASSGIAEYSNVCKLQDKSSTWFADHRSYNDTHFPLIALLYRIWTLSRLNEDSMEPMFSSNKCQFEICVDDVANAIYPDERTRRDEALNCLIAPATGMLTVQKDLRSCSGDREGLGATNSDPMIESSAYYGQWLAKVFDKSWKECFLFPALGIAIVSEHRSLHDH